MDQSERLTLQGRRTKERVLRFHAATSRLEQLPA